MSLLNYIHIILDVFDKLYTGLFVFREKFYCSCKTPSGLNEYMYLNREKELILILHSRAQYI